MIKRLESYVKVLMNKLVAIGTTIFSGNVRADVGRAHMLDVDVFLVVLKHLAGIGGHLWLNFNENEIRTTIHTSRLGVCGVPIFMGQKGLRKSSI